ncbi:glycosyl hydrolase 115 family protein [Hymenobacter psoromatis]|uniref:glycosyl hydrolase 115 family protein n=1 Tax=Hymenobacter psoromatis TaxID=1484116 RepID=UPI001CBF74C8|nr:glycosyl hydrolase 115 family protein [Hymenobacter psoromatis]
MIVNFEWPLTRLLRLLVSATLACLATPTPARAAPVRPIVVNATTDGTAFRLAQGGRSAPIFVDTADAEVVHIAARCLAADVASVAGTQPTVSTQPPKPADYAVFMGTLGRNALIDKLVVTHKIDVAGLKGQWESYNILTVENPVRGIKHGLVLVGSDRRGTAYAAFTLAEALGVSPWQWWADVRPAHQAALWVRAGAHPQPAPAVKYRGVFLNDEDWGLQPWAAKTYEPETNDIGPKTYAKVCELLLRLRANYLWPAMHPSTKPFNSFPGNKVVADQYAIVMGASHHEPMLRNTYEYDEKQLGPWNYARNRQHIYDFWDQRVVTNGKYENLYTVGMRGLNDSGMPGENTTAAKIKVLEEVFADQRRMLAQHVNPDPTKVPQVFVPYKEVLDLYRSGLKVPDDVTLMWVDDNHGYIRQLSTPQEQKRSGGSGVYYHLSYWGEPEDYLWLSTTAPALVWEEMTKAYDYQARTVWLVNVGDLKPAEIGTEFFMRLAWDPDQFRHFNQLHYLQAWAACTFGAAQGPAIGQVLDEYYRLNSVARPEMLQPTRTGFSAVAYGDEAGQRLAALARLVRQTDSLYAQTEPRLKDAFYELVAYPVRAASLMNVKTLQAERSRLYAAQGRASANRYAAEAEAAFAQIKRETQFYNTQMAGGKWNHIMSYQPRDRAAYQMPPVGHVAPGPAAGLRVAVEGTEAVATAPSTLPSFTAGLAEQHFFDVFDTGPPPLAWQATASAPWIQLNPASGTAADEARVWVRVDWARAPAGATLAGTVTVRGAGASRVISLTANRPVGLVDFKGFIEENGAVAIEAAHFSRARPGAAAAWTVVPGLGRLGDAVTPLPATAPSLDTTAAALRQAPRLEYDLQLFTPGPVAITAYCRPTHTIHAGRGLRYAIALNDEPPRIVSLESEEYSQVWAGNILRTAALGQSQHRVAAPGRQVLKIWMVDPGVVLDKLVLRTQPQPLPPSFLGPPETAYPAAR